MDHGLAHTHLEQAPRLQPLFLLAEIGENEYHMLVTRLHDLGVGPGKGEILATQLEQAQQTLVYLSRSANTFCWTFTRPSRHNPAGHDITSIHILLINKYD